MMVTNLISNPTATINLKADTWTSITTVPKTIGTTYFVSVYLSVTGGAIKINDKIISSDQHLSFQLKAEDTSPLALRYRVQSDSPTVKATSMLCCTLEEYRANKTLLDQLHWFSGDTMPLA